MRKWIASFLRNSTVRYGALGCCFVLGLIVLELSWTPRISDIRFWTEGKSAQARAASFPIPLLIRKNPMHIKFSLTFRPWHVGMFTSNFKTCDADIIVNSMKIPVRCRAGKYTLQNYAPYLHTGVNEVEIVIRQTSKRSTEMFFSPWIDAFPYRIIWWYTMFGAIFCILAVFHNTVAGKQWPLTGILAGGALLRLMYVAITPFTTRGYDTEGHLVYIRHLVTHFWIPPAGMGWETHQGPLYYALVTPFLWLSRTFTGTEVFAMTWTQQCSLLLSILTLAAALWTGRMLFSAPEKRPFLLLFGWLVAVYPGLVLFSSRINNDVLFQLVAFVFLGALLRWWKTGTTGSVLAVALVIGLGFLTKGNAYLFIPAFWLSIALRPKTTLRQKIRWILLSGLCVAVMAGWLLVIRYLENDFARLLTPGRGRMNPGLTVRNSWMAYLTFNPVSVLLQPYTSTWSDTLGRHDFWVFFFKSSLFGEFSFGPRILFFSRLLAGLGMGLSVLAGIGLIRGMRQRSFYSIPLFFTFAALLAGAFAYRFLHPQSPNQDFRFSILLLPVCAAFVALGIAGFRSAILRRTALLWSWLFVGASWAFFAFLSIVIGRI